MLHVGLLPSHLVRRERQGSHASTRCLRGGAVFEDAIRLCLCGGKRRVLKVPRRLKSFRPRTPTILTRLRIRHIPLFVAAAQAMAANPTNKAGSTYGEQYSTSIMTPLNRRDWQWPRWRFSTNQKHLISCWKRLCWMSQKRRCSSEIDNGMFRLRSLPPPPLACGLTFQLSSFHTESLR